MIGFARLLTWAIAFVVGAVFGTAGTIGQAAHWGIVPAGLIAGIVGLGALMVALRLLTLDRWAAMAAGFGAMLVTLVLSGPGPGGSIVVPAPPEGQLSTGIVWTLAVPILTALVAAWPSGRATARPPRAATTIEQ